MNKRVTAFAVIAILILAFGMRLWGVGWGLPDSRHYYSYHPDENIVLGVSRQINLFDGKLDPGFYNYGSLYIYMLNATTVLAAVFGFINFDFKDSGAMIHSYHDMYLVGRLLALLLGVLTVYVVWLIGRRAYGRGAGLLAALFFALMPLHVMHSKFLAVDVPAAFFVSLALLFALKIAQDGHRLRDYIGAGILTGLAAGTKYNAGLVIIAPIIAHFLSVDAQPLRRKLSAKLFVIPTAAALGFLIGTPGVLLNYEKFSRDFLFEMQHVRTGHGLVFVNTGNGWVYHFVHSLLPGMGLPLLLLGAVGLLYALRKRTVADWTLLSFFLIYFLTIGMAQVRFARYVILLLPLLALFAARVCMDLISQFETKRALAYLGVAAAVVVSGYALLYSVAIDGMFVRPDTRDQASDWIKTNVPDGTAIGMATVPWFYTPPLDPNIGAAASAEQRYNESQKFSDYRLVVPHADSEWDTDQLLRNKPEHVVITEFEYRDALRLKKPDAVRYFKALDSDYNLEKRISDGPTICGFHLPFNVELPHDMSYVSPTILIYSRKV